MDYSKQIQKVKARIEELDRAKQLLYKIEEEIIRAEREVDDINASLPSDARIRAMRPGEEKRQLQELTKLVDEAFATIDEILGPPDDENWDDAPEGTGYEMPGTVCGDAAAPDIPWMPYNLKGPSTKS